MSKKSFFSKPFVKLGAIGLGMVLMLGSIAQYTKASDHDDGETDTKGRNLNLTDLYVFREGDQNSSASNHDLILVMNTNPRSLARQQYYFSTRARYDFNISRVSNKDATPIGTPDLTLRFEFSAPNQYKEQPFKITAIRNGNYKTINGLKTTPLAANPSQTAKVNNIKIDGHKLAVFAGLREDPFFFDVEQYFRVRAGALGIGPAVGFRDATQAIDFAKGYNVNAIVVRVPISFLQGNSSNKTFDVWETISVPKHGNQFTQVERLARPAINEGLIVTNNLLNTLNQISPKFEADALAGRQPAATQAAPIVTEAKQTLMAIGNSSQRADALLQAFLPDVMRIDTTIASGYANALNAKSSPIAGRMLKDDVVDITLSVLTNGAISSDNVSYDGTPSNPSQCHKPLDTSFPYLALPN